jgi:hypothetical protein
MRTIFAGITAGCIGFISFLFGIVALSMFGYFVYPPMVGLSFGLIRKSKAEAYRAAAAGLFGATASFALMFIGGIFAKPAIALTKSGVPAKLLLGMTDPYAWGLALVAATPARMAGSRNGALLAGAICFLGVNLVNLAEPITIQLNEWSGIAGLLGRSLPYVLNGLVLRVSVKLSEAKRDG